MNHKTDMQAKLQRIASELRAYNPAVDEYKGEHIHKVWAREIEAALASHPDAQADQDGYVVVAVKGLQALDTALDRAESKGYLPDAIADEWAAFDWKPAPTVAQQPVIGDAQADERGALDGVRPLVDEWIRSRGTSMDGAAYGAAIELAAFVAARAAAPKAEAAQGVPEGITEGLEILDNFIASVRENGNYSTEATLTFIGQARQCFAAAPAPVSEPYPATLCEDGGKCGIGGYCGQCEKVRAASEPEQPSKRGEQDCPHGVDDGACKQCYGEAVRGEQGAAYSHPGCEVCACPNGYCQSDRAPDASAPTLDEQRSTNMVAPDERQWPSDQNSAKHRYFVYDPEGNGFDLYDTDAQRDAAHQAAIAEARLAAIDDGEWGLDVERIVSGFVTHATVATDMDGGGYDYAPLSTFNASAPMLGDGDGEVAVRAKTVHRRIDALCEAANTAGTDYFDASTSMLIATRDLLTTLGFPHRMDALQPQAAEPKGMTEEQRNALMRSYFETIAKYLEADLPGLALNTAEKARALLTKERDGNEK